MVTIFVCWDIKLAEHKIEWGCHASFKYSIAGPDPLDREMIAVPRCGLLALRHSAPP